MSNVVRNMLTEWVDLRTTLSTFRVDVCFICESAPIQVRAHGFSGGTCKSCDVEAREVDE